MIMTSGGSGVIHGRKSSFNLFWTIVVSLVLFMGAHAFLACQGGDDDDADPTPTAVMTPTITPTPTVSGNAPIPVYPKDDIVVTTEGITFDWTDSIGATEYWFSMHIWYEANGGGEWIPLWWGFYQWSSASQITISRSDIWFFDGEEDLGWQHGRYRWSVTGDTSTAWSIDSYFTWNE